MANKNLVENVVRMIVPSFLIGSSLNLQVTRTGIKSQTSSILAKLFRLFALELLALERQNFFPYNYNGENVHIM